jgi:23S rRNA pseudouridine2605 synthase
MIRLQKLLADLGLGSRRAVEDWIRAGRLTVNGKTAQLGDRAAPGDDVRLDGRRLEFPRVDSGDRQLLLYYKPVGEVTTRHDPDGRPTVFERLPQPAAGRWITVGRLDVNTTGLLLLTTDGDLAHGLMHPSSEVPREYLVRVRGRPGPEVLRRLLAGVRLEDGPARFDAITPEEDAAEGPSNASFRVTLHEGRNREVRRLFEAVGFEVSRLLRIRYGPIELPRDMRPGQARMADAALLGRLKSAMAAEPPGFPVPEAPAPPRRTPPGGLRRRPPSK